MYSHISPRDFVVVAIIMVAVFVGRLVVEILDRATASPAMRQRVNAGSDRFFDGRGSVWEATARSTADFLSQLRRRRWDDDVWPPRDS